MNGNGHGPRQVIPLGFRATDNRREYRCQCCGFLLIRALQFGPLAGTSGADVECGKCGTAHRIEVTTAGIVFSCTPSAKGLRHAEAQYAHDRLPRIDKPAP